LPERDVVLENPRMTWVVERMIKHINMRGRRVLKKSKRDSEPNGVLRDPSFSFEMVTRKHCLAMWYQAQ
jgi:hypothetical protein